VVCAPYEVKSGFDLQQFYNILALNDCRLRMSQQDNLGPDKDLEMEDDKPDIAVTLSKTIFFEALVHHNLFSFTYLHKYCVSSAPVPTAILQIIIPHTL
jgi:hypothetical protein